MEITAFPLAEAQRGLSFPNSSPGPSEVWDSFYPGSETAQEFTGSCFFSFTELQPLPFMQRRAEPGKHTEREGKSLFPPLPELLFPLLPSQMGLCTAPEAPTLGFFPHGFQSVKKPHFGLVLWPRKLSEQDSHWDARARAAAAGPCGHSVLSRQDLGCWEWEDPEVLRAQGARPQPCSLAELPLCTSKAPDPSLNQQQQQNSCQKKLPVGSPEQENPNSQEEFSECS